MTVHQLVSGTICPKCGHPMELMSDPEDVPSGAIYLGHSENNPRCEHRIYSYEREDER